MLLEPLHGSVARAWSGAGEELVDLKETATYPVLKAVHKGSPKSLRTAAIMKGWLDLLVC